MKDDSNPEKSEIPFADEVLQRWLEFRHSRTLLIEVTLPDEVWGKIVKMTHGVDGGIGRLAEEALECCVEEFNAQDREDAT